MSLDSADAEAVVIGGGFYGSTIAIYLARQRGFRRVVLLEMENDLLHRASYNNQARVHNGYHYPRSFTTAYRSRINLPKFTYEWPDVIKRDFINLYAIARRNSKVTSKQFERFCHEISAKIEPANADLCSLFEPRLIESVFVVEEYAFDANQLAQWAKKELLESGINVRLGSRASAIYRSPENGLLVSTQSKLGDKETIRCKYVFNCTYSGMSQFGGDFSGVKTGLKQEVTEMALIRVPDEFKNLGVTVMDGPFFSIMPFPARSLHTLSHVRYTPHFSWQDELRNDPYRILDSCDRTSRFDRMIRDVGRYLPRAIQSEHVDSLFEIKTVLVKNEGDDGRPILFEKHAELAGCYSILGGKIDNVFDVLEKLESEKF